MANSINGVTASNATSIGTSRASQEGARDASLGNSGSPAAQAPAEASGDDVQITSTASRLASLGQTLSASPAVDSDRVARISQSIADGSYSVSADSIAAGLLQSDRGLAQIGL